jgi:CheY-like chemotaxis protein
MTALVVHAASMARILVVEDEPAIRELLVLVLGDEGHAVLAAPDGQAALAILRRHPVDLVVTDAMMPRLDGPGLIAQMRALPGLGALPVLLMSAAGVGSPLRDPGTVFLAKPFDLGQLLGLVQAALEHASDGGAQRGQDERPGEHRKAGEG